MNISALNSFLERVSTFINIQFFNNTLKDFVITVYENKGTYGHLTTWDKWTINKEDKKEININPILFEQSTEQVITTLFHEMIHLYNLQNGIVDTSRQGRYHNIKFKNACDMFGLECYQDDKFGYAITPCVQEQYKHLFDQFKAPIVKIKPKSKQKQHALKNWLYDHHGNKIKLDEETTKKLLKYLEKEKK